MISLYTLDDCVSIVFETEPELQVGALCCGLVQLCLTFLQDWMDQLLTLQQGKAGNIDGKKPVPNFEHVFTVNVKTFTPEENNFTRVHHLMGQHRSTLRFQFIQSSVPSFVKTVLHRRNEWKSIFYGSGRPTLSVNSSTNVDRESF